MLTLKTVRGAIVYIAYLACATLFVLLALEAILRVGFGRPDGRFRISPLDGKTLYFPGSTIRMYTGPIPYTVTTNSLGFRGPEIAVEKPAGVTRIVALGDSVTDGFYVDNADTFPVRLEGMLRGAGHNVEVINTARGDSSIDLEATLFKRLAEPLDPDIVLLTFVTNDIDAIRGAPREDLIREAPRAEEPGVGSGALLAATTALGELVLDMSLRSRFENYRGFERSRAAGGGDTRYAIPGGDNIAENLRIFREKHCKRTDSILLYETFDAGQRETVENYLFALEHFRDYCRERGIRLGLLYCPGYNQVHDPASSLLLRDLIEAGCAARGIPFHDMTPRFREAARIQPIDLAPVDYHPTPYGNEVIAGEAARFLETQFLTAAGPAPE
ncbi:MAG: SGNH/GDSL hydrolase family protein [Candidatus Hydrogenedentes bacterium]|nr:SGNH/GDSL hydrolase family protein [Candidatus Hydrogenedentota bacterium]